MDGCVFLMLSLASNVASFWLSMFYFRGCIIRCRFSESKGEPLPVPKKSGELTRFFSPKTHQPAKGQPKKIGSFSKDGSKIFVFQTFLVYFRPKMMIGLPRFSFVLASKPFEYRLL